MVITTVPTSKWWGLSAMAMAISASVVRVQVQGVHGYVPERGYEVGAVIGGPVPVLNITEAASDLIRVVVGTSGIYIGSHPVTCKPRGSLSNFPETTVLVSGTDRVAMAYSGDLAGRNFIGDGRWTFWCFSHFDNFLEKTVLMSGTGRVAKAYLGQLAGRDFIADLRWHSGREAWP